MSINNICYFCKSKVNKFDNTDGHMLAYNRLFHFTCVKEYSYHKFCTEVINFEKNQFTDDEIKKQLEKACKLMDLADEQRMK